MFQEIAYLIIGIIILFVPGFLLSFILFSGSESLDFWERIATSVGLSAFVDMFIITILALKSFRALRLFPFVGSVLGFCAVCGGVIFFRKESLQTFANFLNKLGFES